MAPVTILDGGTGHLLKEKGLVTSLSGTPAANTFVEGVVANVEQPHVVKAVHAAYIEAGADVITVNNFGCTLWNMQRFDLTLDPVELSQVLAAGVEARHVLRRKRWVSYFGACVRVS